MVASNIEQGSSDYEIDKLINTMCRPVTQQNSQYAPSHISSDYALPLLLLIPSHDIPSHELEHGFHPEQSTAQLLTGTLSAASSPLFHCSHYASLNRQLLDVCYLIGFSELLYYSKKDITSVCEVNAIVSSKGISSYNSKEDAKIKFDTNNTRLNKVTKNPASVTNFLAINTLKNKAINSNIKKNPILFVIE